MKSSLRTLTALALLMLLSPIAVRGDALSDETFAQWRKADAILNEAYNHLMATLDDQGKIKLREAERAWIKFRDAECDLAAHDSRGGTMTRLDYAGRELDLTNQRIDQLKSYERDFAEPLPEPDDTLTRIEMPDATDAAKTLSECVSVRCRQDPDGSRTATLFNGDTQCQLELTRSAEFLCFSSEPGVVIVLDAFVSNEDRLVIYDFRNSRVKQTVIGHKDFDYIHQHFNIKGGKAGKLELEEQEWAGTAAPRARSLALTVTGETPTITRGAWHTVEN